MLADENRDRYLDLLKRNLTRLLHPEEDFRRYSLARTGWRRIPAKAVEWAARRAGVRLVHRDASDAGRRAAGLSWPQHGETMVGIARLENVRDCLERAIDEGVEGDFVETGVWRGGASIYAKAVLDTLGATDRRVWLADSFRGLPRPDVERYPADAGLDFWQRPILAVDANTVRANFERYGLLDDRVMVVEGWFKDTLPSAPVGAIAVLRLDGDLYESTMDALTALYPKVSPGGFVIVDDFHIAACRRAIDDYRADHQIQDPIVDIDGCGAFWQRSR